MQVRWQTPQTDDMPSLKIIRRRARVKCDEVLPTCSACQRLRLICQRGVPTAPSRTSSFRRFVLVPASPPPCTQPPRPHVVDEPAQVALHFFCLRTLPILRICQPSQLWDNIITSLLQNDESIRNIAVAIGFAQQLQVEPHSEVVSDTVQKQALLSYSAALHSLRRSIVSESAKAPSIHAFACLLMVILESLRGSHSALLVHLRSGLSITAGDQCTPELDDMKQKTSSLLQKYRVSSSLFGLFATRNATLNELITQNTYLVEPRPWCPYGERSATWENSAVIGSSVKMWHCLSEAATAAQRDRVCSVVPVLRAQNASARNLWSLGERTEAQEQPQRGFAEAQRRLVDLTLQSAATTPSSDPKHEVESLSGVLDLLETSLGQLRASRGWEADEREPFSVGKNDNARPCVKL